MITQGYLSRHFQGRRGMADVALLDVVQDYALAFLHQQGLFELPVVLKGGTSLRKFRAGNAGRFSTDLDFAAPDVGAAELIFDTLDGAMFFDAQFRVVDRGNLRARLEIDTPFGAVKVPAKIEVSPRPLWLPTSLMMPVKLPVHDGYEFTLPALPVPAIEEAIAEKLAAWRRRRKIRDLYDLHLFGQGVLDEPLVRRLLVLKVWHDVVDDGIGNHPFNPDEILADLDVRKLPPEDIGLLTQPVDPVAWLTSVRHRYRFIDALDDDEHMAAQCNPGDRYAISQVLAALIDARHS